MRQRNLIRQRPHGRRKALVPEHHRLEVEGEAPQLTDRRAVALERAADDLLRFFAATFADRVQAGVEQKRDAGEGLHGAVV